MGRVTEPVSIEDQIKCAQREVALRRNTYPRLMTAKRMNPLQAETEIRRMEAILETLREVQAQRGSGKVPVATAKPTTPRGARRAESDEAQ